MNRQTKEINYGFDNAYRLTSEVRSGDNSYSISYAYDGVGNRTSQTKDAVTTAYTYNIRNQLTQDVTGSITKTYSYDNNGNQVGETGGGVTKTLSYDTLNRMTSWSDGTNTETHAYAGAEWHRISTSSNGMAVAYVYDGDNVVADCVAGSDPEGPSYMASKYYTTPFLDQNVGMYVVNGETLTPYYYTQDGLGSVRTLTNSAGTTVNSYDYTAFGEVFSATTSETLAQRYTYTGRETNPSSGTMNFRIRTIDNRIGRFLQRAPENVVNKYEGHFFPNRTDPYGLPVTDSGEGLPLSPNTSVRAMTDPSNTLAVGMVTHELSAQFDMAISNAAKYPCIDLVVRRMTTPAIMKAALNKCDHIIYIGHGNLKPPYVSLYDPDNEAKDIDWTKNKAQENENVIQTMHFASCYGMSIGIDVTNKNWENVTNPSEYGFYAFGDAKDKALKSDMIQSAMKNLESFKEFGLSEDKTTCCARKTVCILVSHQAEAIRYRSR